MEQIQETSTMRASAIGSSQTARHTSTQIPFGQGSRDVHPAVDEPVDQRANDLGAIQQFAGLAAVGRREAIEVVDLSIEQDHRDLRPRLVMDGRTSRSWLRTAGSR